MAAASIAAAIRPTQVVELDDWPTSRHETRDDDDEGNDQQNVNEAAGDMECKKAECPQDY